MKNKEVNKFKGICYCAISSTNRKVIAVESGPDRAYYKAVSKGEIDPIIVRGKIID